MANIDNTGYNAISTGVAGRACEACHQKKTRCDMQQPVCGLCQRTGRECHFPSTRKRPTRQGSSVRAKMQKVNGNLDRLVQLLEADSDTKPNIHQIANLEGINLSPQQQGISTDSASLTDKVMYGDLNQSPGIYTGAQALSTGTKGDAAPHSFDSVSYELATHLIDVFFDKIAPWLFIFHRPKFLEWSSSVLLPGDDTTKNLGPVESMLFNGMFSLAARYAEHPSLASLNPISRGERFIRSAEYWFKRLRDYGAEDLGFDFLRGCILLAYYHYTTGTSQRGYYITHMCIRGCYEFGLHEIDDDDEPEESDDSTSWIDLELLRRSFWAIWEIDSFGAIIKNKPFGIDRRHIQVKLPVNDMAWYAGQPVDSPLMINGSECWKSLAGSANQDERTWCLLAKAFVGYVFDTNLNKDGVSDDARSAIENNIICFKLAMPQTMHLSSCTTLDNTVHPARKNFIIATNLYLSATTFRTARLHIIDQSPAASSEAKAREIAKYNSRVAELSEIMRMWPTESISYAHPTIAATLLTYDESLVRLLPTSNLINSYRDLTGLILAKFAERWGLGAVLLRVRDLAHNYQNSDDATKADLVRQYSVFFHRPMRNKVAQKKLLAQLSSPSSYRSSRTSSLSESAPVLSATIQSSTFDQYAQQQVVGGDKIAAADVRNDMYTPDKFDIPDFQSLSSFEDSPPGNLDAIFSGFIQEPMWQDFGVIDFVI